MSEQPEIDIYKSLRTTRIFLISLSVIMIVVIVFCVYQSYKFASDAQRLVVNKVLKINSKTGEVENAILVDRAIDIKIEIGDHLEKWVDKFYSFDFNNSRKKPLQAQWLMASNDYNELMKEYEPWHREVEVKKLTQKAVLEPDSLKVPDRKAEPFDFSTSAVVTVSDGYTNKTYRLFMNGKIIFVDADYPKNPHGFLIKDYKWRLEKIN